MRCVCGEGQRGFVSAGGRLWRRGGGGAPRLLRTRCRWRCRWLALRRRLLGGSALHLANRGESREKGCGGVLRVRVCLECVWGRRVVYAVHLCGRTRLECDEWYDVAQCLAHTLKRGRRGPPGVGTASAPKYKRARDPRERWARFRGGRVLECRRTERLAERASRHSLTGDCWRGIWNRCGDGCVSSLIASDEGARRVLSAAAVRKLVRSTRSAAATTHGRAPWRRRAPPARGEVVASRAACGRRPAAQGSDGQSGRSRPAVQPQKASR